MKGLIVACLLVVAVSASKLEEVGSKFQAFKLKHGKTYKNQAEETTRFNIFQDNLRSIEAHNVLYEQGLSSYKQGINQFTDMTQQEFGEMQRLRVSSKPHFNATSYVKSGLAIPASVDWRTQGQVGEVKDQGNCGACWAFSITGSTEGAYYRKHGQSVSLSEQQLIDCSTSINFGCDGGYLEQTFPYVENSGIQSEESYPYTARNGRCQYDDSAVVTKVTGYVVIQPKDEDALLDAVANVGPVSVGIRSAGLSFYNSGIYEDFLCSLYPFDHAVLIVGYGTENNKNFWIVKNSWGKSYGEDGYFRITRGKNECSIAEDTVYPTIA